MPRGQPGKRQQFIPEPQLLLQKDLALLNPHVSKLTTDGHIWVSNGLWLLRFHGMQSSSVLLPDLFLRPGKTVLCSSSAEKKLLLHGVGAAADSQKGLLPGDFEVLQKTFNEGQLFFSGAGQGSRQECSTVLEQINPRAVPRLTMVLG